MEQHGAHPLEHVRGRQRERDRLQPSRQHGDRVVDAGHRGEQEDRGPGELLGAQPPAQDHPRHGEPDRPAERQQVHEERDQRQSVRLGKRLPPLVGWIDVVEQAPDGTVTVADLKTASKRYSDHTVHANLQLTCYSLGAQTLGFNGDTRFRLDVLLKTQNPELIRYETTRTNADRERFLKLVKGVWQGIKKEVFFPKEDWQCGQCPFAGPCKEW